MYIQAGEPMPFFKNDPAPGTEPQNPNTFDKDTEEARQENFGAGGGDCHFPPGALEHFRANSGQYFRDGQQE